MLDKIALISEELMERASALITHIQDALTNADWKYDPSLSVLTKELYLKILELEHKDFLKLHAFINFKMKVTLNLSFDYDGHNSNWLIGNNIINFLENVTPKLNREEIGAITSQILQYHMYGFINLHEFYNPAFYNWYAVNAMNEEIMLAYRKSCSGHSHEVLTWRKKANFNRTALNSLRREQKPVSTVELTETGELVEMQNGKFYIVTDSTSSCKILKLERFDAEKHSDFLLGKNLNGLIIKNTPTVDWFNVQFLYNNLHTATFDYDISLLGLKHVSN